MIIPFLSNLLDAVSNSSKKAADHLAQIDSEITELERLKINIHGEERIRINAKITALRNRRRYYE